MNGVFYSFLAIQSFICSLFSSVILYPLPLFFFLIVKKAVNVIYTEECSFEFSSLQKSICVNLCVSPFWHSSSDHTCVKPSLLDLCWLFGCIHMNSKIYPTAWRLIKRLWNSYRSYFGYIIVDKLCWDFFWEGDTVSLKPKWL